MSITELDNPVWHSLTGIHKNLAIGGDLAKRYPSDIFGGVGIKESTEAAFTELASFTEPDETIFALSSSVPEDRQWEIVFSVAAPQMVCKKAISMPKHEVEIHSLGIDDVLEMLALIELTEPGPFLERTIEFGSYFGIQQDGKLVAMAGSRMFTPHYREISAVCTHPDYRGRGYAALLVQVLAHQFQQEGITPFLHTGPTNHTAIRLYEKLGFELHQEILIAVFRLKEN